MLQELFIQDFAIIDSLNLSFAEGLNILSGETGAGKSIIIGALNLLMGGRAYAELIRSSKDEAVVEALFNLKNNEPVRIFLASCGITYDGDTIVIRRIISRAGKNKIFIANRLATMQMLSQLGRLLFDISGQHSQQLLLQTDKHLDILDEYGGLLPLRASFETCYNAYQAKLKELLTLLQKEQDKAHRQQLLTFQRDELAEANLSLQEEEELLAERAILENTEKLYEKTYGAYMEIYESPNSCMGVLKKLLQQLKEASEIDQTVGSLQETMESAVINLEDVALSLRSYADKIPKDTGRLENIEKRLDEIRRLKAKYNMNLKELLSYQTEIANELQNIASNSEQIKSIEEQLKQDRGNLFKLAQGLSKKRKEAAKKLKYQIEDELAAIEMKNTEFIVNFETITKATDLLTYHELETVDISGMDKIEFFISPNPGEPPLPLSKIASGGELSRIVLAIKKILAANYHVPTMVFDEVDSGIGGAVAEAVGERLKEIAKTHQILCITHLPQIASFANLHYSVRKHTQNGRTVTSVKRLNADEQIEEIARMLGGRKVSEKTRAHAIEMVKNARKRGKKNTD